MLREISINTYGSLAVRNRSKKNFALKRCRLKKISKKI